MSEEMHFPNKNAFLRGRISRLSALEFYQLGGRVALELGLQAELSAVRIMAPFILLAHVQTHLGHFDVTTVTCVFCHNTRRTSKTSGETSGG